MNASRALLVALATVMVLATAGCGPSADEAETVAPAAQALDGLLGLRAERSTDASAYAEYVADPTLAVQLAMSSAEETGVPTPAWETPYVASETTSTAEVVVVWIPDEEYPDWPPATVFTMLAVDGSWKAVDATPVHEGEPVPPEL